MAGYLQGVYACENLSEGAKIVYILGSLGFSDVEERKEGFYAAIEEYDRTDIEILAEQTGEWSRETSLALMEDWLIAYDEIDGVIAQNEAMALGAIEAIKVADRLDEFEVISGIDGTVAGLESVAAGEMDSTCMQDAAGQTNMFIEVFDELVAGATVDSEYMIDFVIITIDNVDDYL